MNRWIGNALHRLGHWFGAPGLNYEAILNRMVAAYELGEVEWDESGKAVDFVYRAVNPAFYQLTGLRDVIGKRVMTVVPTLEPEWLERIERVMRTGVADCYENRVAYLNQVFQAVFFKVDEKHFAATFFQTTELHKLQYELLHAYHDTLVALSSALDLRDHETAGHSQRVTDMTLTLAGATGRFTPDELVHLRRGALLHDIGKIGVPDSILNKPAPLNPDERRIMELHPAYAKSILEPIAYLHPAIDIPYCHHEKWNGTGYPRGLAREQIPLAARVFAVVDVYDALISRRPYRDPWTIEVALAHIASKSGTHFDPNVVDTFLELMRG